MKNGRTLPTCIVATGKQGTAPGELYIPSGAAIHVDTEQLFVVNQVNFRVEVFSETGEFLYKSGVGQLYYPNGLAIHGDSVFVSCLGDHTVSKFSLTDMCRIKIIGGEGSNNGKFHNPFQLTTDSIGRLFIADYGNDRICIHDPNLKHLRNITHQSISRPYDVKVSLDRLYVLCQDSNPCMQVLNLEGDKLHSLISHGEGMDVSSPRFFCLDLHNNFVISDEGSNSIRVFSPEGNLLHTIGKEGHRPGGVAITPNARLFRVSRDKNYGLQIFDY